jgi:hypothetical protein
MWFLLVINFMLPMEHPLIMLKTRFVIHCKTYLMIYIMECPKLCPTIFIPEWNTFKIKPSKVDSLKICVNGWFTILTLCLNPDFVRIKIWHATHISALSAHMFPCSYHYTTESSELMVLAEGQGEIVSTSSFCFKTIAHTPESHEY